jgi:gluconolactonase
MTVNISRLPGPVTEFIGGDPTFQSLDDRFEFLEGPAYDHRRGRLYLSDIVASTTWAWSPEDGAEQLSTTPAYANGHLVITDGRVLQAEHRTRRVVEIDPETGEATRVLADSFGGKHLNSPNQLLELPDGTILFTDPGYGLLDPYGGPAVQEQPIFGVYAITDDPAAPQLVVADVPAAHKIVLRPDGRQLLVNDSSTGLIRAYPVDGGLVDGSKGTRLAALGADAGLDGMVFTGTGLLVVTSVDGLLVVDPDGTHGGNSTGALLATLPVPDEAHNLAWGGERNDELFVTATRHLFRLRCSVPGPRQ